MAGDNGNSNPFALNCPDNMKMTVHPRFLNKPTFQPYYIKNPVLRSGATDRHWASANDEARRQYFPEKYQQGARRPLTMADVQTEPEELKFNMEDLDYEGLTLPGISRFKPRPWWGDDAKAEWDPSLFAWFPKGMPREERQRMLSSQGGSRVARAGMQGSREGRSRGAQYGRRAVSQNNENIEWQGVAETFGERKGRPLTPRSQRSLARLQREQEKRKASSRLQSFKQGSVMSTF